MYWQTDPLEPPARVCRIWPQPVFTPLKLRSNHKSLSFLNLQFIVVIFFSLITKLINTCRPVIYMDVWRHSFSQKFIISWLKICDSYLSMVVFQISLESFNKLPYILQPKQYSLDKKINAKLFHIQISLHEIGDNNLGMPYETFQASASI